MIKLFPNYKEVELTEDKDKENHEWYKGVVFDPDTKEFKVVKGLFTDKKDFYEKLTKRGYIVRRGFEANIWDWIQENAKTTLDAYLMCSTAVSKWRDTNLLDNYYIKLMNDFPQLNREKIKGNPNTRGKKDESIMKEDKDFDISDMRPQDDIEGYTLVDLKAFGIEDFDVKDENIYAVISEKSKYIKEYIEKNNLEGPASYCYIWKKNFSIKDLGLSKTELLIVNKLLKLHELNQTDELKSQVLAFIDKKAITNVNDELINKLCQMSVDDLNAEKERLKQLTASNTQLSLTTDHEFVSWEDIKEKSTEDDKFNGSISVAIAMKDWDKYLKNTPVDSSDALHVNKSMPFACVEKLQELNSNVSFKFLGLSTEGYDYIQRVNTATIELVYTQLHQTEQTGINATQSFEKSFDDANTKNADALKSLYTADINKSDDIDLINKLKDTNTKISDMYKTGAFKWKNNPEEFLQKMKNLHDLNSVRTSLETQKNANKIQAMNNVLAKTNTSTADLNTGDVMLKPASRMHGGDSEGAYINNVNKHINDQIKAKANELNDLQDIENLKNTLASISARITSEPENIALRKAYDKVKKQLARKYDAFKLSDTGSHKLKLSADEEQKVQKALAAMNSKQPVKIRASHDYNPDKLIKNFIKNRNKAQESYRTNFRNLLENIISVPDNYNATLMYCNEPSMKSTQGAVIPMYGTIREDSTDTISLENHDTLNQKIFDMSDEKVKDDVREAMMKVAKDFYDKLEFTPELVDVYFTGSNANYNYNDNSDIDVHLVFDFERAGINAELLTEYFKLKKKIYNDQHDIKIKGYPVEVGIENVNTPLVSTGVYSLKQNKWVKSPSKDTFDNAHANFGDYEQAVNYIERAINTKDPQQILRLWKEIAKGRRESLAQGGETAPYNIIFKKLRAEGYLKRLQDAYYEYASKDLSLESLEEII